MVKSAELAADFARLLPNTRLARGMRAGLHGLESSAMSDKARVVFSSAFRRLQTKAQVFSLDRDASVRTRLTHSLEVAICGELLAERAFQLLLKSKHIDPNLEVRFIGTVENACLLHDIGNPPFGHLGEFAIQEWFRAKREEITRRWGSNRTIDRYSPGFEHFNGNAQSFRIVTKLQWLDGPAALGLTHALLAAMVKYLTPNAKGDGPFSRKVGYFETEGDIIREVWRELKLRVKGDVPDQRHPLTFLMEAADDIAYSLSDIEDALEKGVLTESDFFAEFEQGIDLLLRRYTPATSFGRIAKTNGDDVKYSKFLRVRSVVTLALIEAAARVFADHAYSIVHGTWHRELLEGDSDVAEFVKRLKALAKRRIFLAPEAVDVEVSGYRIVQSLLDGFMPLLALHKSAFEDLAQSDSYERQHAPLERRLYSLLGKRQLRAYYHFTPKDAGLDAVNRTHLVVDFVSGMTDSFAVKVFNIITGASVGGSL